MSSVVDKVNKVNGESKVSGVDEVKGRKVDPELNPAGSFMVEQCGKCGKDKDMVEVKTAGVIPYVSCRDCGE